MSPNCASASGRTNCDLKPLQNIHAVIGTTGNTVAFNDMCLSVSASLTEYSGFGRIEYKLRNTHIFIWEQLCTISKCLVWSLV